MPALNILIYILIITYGTSTVHIFLIMAGKILSIPADLNSLKLSIQSIWPEGTHSTLFLTSWKLVVLTINNKFH